MKAKHLNFSRTFGDSQLAVFYCGVNCKRMLLTNRTSGGLSQDFAGSGQKLGHCNKTSSSRVESQRSA